MERNPLSAGGRLGSGHSYRDLPGEGWRDDPSLLTVPTEWKDEVPDLKHDPRNSRIKLSGSGRIHLLHVGLFQCSASPTSPCSWLPAITSVLILPRLKQR